MEEKTPLILKYRPTTFDEVVGQDRVVRGIASAIKRRSGRSFLLAGPSGVGKTTTARIIAREVGCQSFDLIEVDGATTTGIDAMRELTAHLQYKSVGEAARAIILDECHALSSQAVKSLLKVLEEPSASVYWILCTTEPSKVPKEVRNRCLEYDFKLVQSGVLVKLLTTVAKAEKFPIRRSREALEAVAELAEGSPRRALSMLAQSGHLRDEEEVRALCGSEEGTSKEAVDLCRLLMKGASWKQLVDCVKGIDAPAETVRIIVLRYMASVALGGKNPQQQLAIMDAFSEPFADREGKAPLLLALGRLCFQD